MGKEVKRVPRHAKLGLQHGKGPKHIARRRGIASAATGVLERKKHRPLSRSGSEITGQRRYTVDPKLPAKSGQDEKPAVADAPDRSC